MLRRDAMRISLAFGAVFSIAAIMPAQAAEPQISGPLAKVGAPAPDFRAPDMNGKSVALSDFRGKVVEWTNHECTQLCARGAGGGEGWQGGGATADARLWLHDQVCELTGKHVGG